MKICQYLLLQMKIICWRFHTKTTFTFCEMRTSYMWKVYWQTFRNNRIWWKLAYFLRNFQTSRVNISRVPRIKNANFSGHYFYMIANIVYLQKDRERIKKSEKYYILKKPKLIKFSANQLETNWRQFWKKDTHENRNRSKKKCRKCSCLSTKFLSLERCFDCIIGKKRHKKSIINKCNMF